MFADHAKAFDCQCGGCKLGTPIDVRDRRAAAVA
eukprot:CAMPEP_0170250958 /NCGR_PEP_ID=MMETSP0116_2-20130129/25304_1 /TAXON_ID=400756 /ORGANISM="Durinskia baltica, Strain CSIRO CS-38" /LENGTH=33 /DNA_ID= /DNA_START= /DNA_END= /DNA_ORIENTATION=